jgi:hypothetical protein
MCRGKNLVQQTTDRRQGYSLHAQLFNISINVTKYINIYNAYTSLIAETTICGLLVVDGLAVIIYKETPMRSNRSSSKTLSRKHKLKRVREVLG